MDLLNSFVNNWNTKIFYAHNMSSFDKYVPENVFKELGIGYLISLGTYLSSKVDLNTFITIIKNLEKLPYAAIYIDSGGFQYIKGKLTKKDIDSHIKVYFELIDYIDAQYKQQNISKPIFIFSLDIPACRANNTDDVVDEQTSISASYDVYSEIARRFKEYETQRQFIITVLHFSPSIVYQNWKQIYQLPNLNMAQYVATGSSWWMHKKPISVGAYNVLHYCLLRANGFKNIKLYHILGTKSLDRLYPSYDVLTMYNISITHDTTPYTYYRPLLVPIYNKKTNRYNVTKLDIRSNKLQLIKIVDELLGDNVAKWVESMFDELNDLSNVKHITKTKNIKVSKMMYVSLLDILSTLLINKVIDKIDRSIYTEFKINRDYQFKLLELADQDPEKLEQLLLPYLDKFIED